MFYRSGYSVIPVKMSKRTRDIGRKYTSGSKKRAIEIAKETDAEKQSGAIEKFVFKSPLEQPHAAESDESTHNERYVSPSASGDEEQNEPLNDIIVEDKCRATEETDCHINVAENIVLDTELCDHEEMPLVNSSTQVPSSTQEISDVISNFADPSLWPKYISTANREFIVRKGPQQKKPESYDYPKDSTGRRFSHNHYERKLPNGEIVNRQWLVWEL